MGNLDLSTFLYVISGFTLLFLAYVRDTYRRLEALTKQMGTMQQDLTEEIAHHRRHHVTRVEFEELKRHKC